jgi:integrase
MIGFTSVKFHFKRSDACSGFGQAKLKSGFLTKEKVMAIDRISRTKGSVWRARVLLLDGRRRSQCFKRKADAELWEARLKADGLNSSESKRKQTKFEDLCGVFLQGAQAELSAATYEKYESTIRKYLRPKFEGLWLEDISRLRVEEFKNELLGFDLSNGTKRFIFCSLNTIFRKGMDLELLIKNPAQSVKRPRGGMHRTEYWTKAEVLQFLGAVRDTARFPLYFIALNTGMRLGEILGLKWDCVDFNNGHIEVCRTFDQKTKQVKETTKTHKSRSIGMSATVRAFLSRRYSNRKGEFVLDRDELGCKDSSHAAREFAADIRKAGLRVIRFHDLRHTFATAFVEKDGSIHALSNILGHSTTSMTSRYAHFTAEHARALHQNEGHERFCYN